MHSTLMLLMIIRKIYEWTRTPEIPWIRQNNKRLLIRAYFLYRMQKIVEDQVVERRFWVRPIFTEERRLAQGASNNLIPELVNTDYDKFVEYLRLTPDMFNELLELVRPRITKQRAIREPISAVTRLQICLRYLAGGGTMSSISFAFRVGVNTVSQIIPETCEAIQDALMPKVFPLITEEIWLQKAEEFKSIWNFPNCIGAIDGCHIEIQAPPNSGSTYFNYKGTHSIVLLAVADANALFTLVDVGGEGRRSDGGIFYDCEFGERFRNNTMNLPAPQQIGNRGPSLPFVLVGDEAFGLSEYMMRPFSKARTTEVTEKVFNYRLSRARRIVECAFGILTSRWRILEQAMATDVETSEKIVEATVCLHNFIMEKDLKNPPTRRVYFPSGPLPYISNDDQPIEDEEPDELLVPSDQSRQAALNWPASIRNQFTKYFTERDVLSNQMEKALHNNF